MRFHPIDGIRLVWPRRALELVFDECDRHARDETGGRVVGIYEGDGDELRIEVTGVLGPGPAARRSPVSFFQDGHYQERVFRRIEREHPETEHLGNWHTHHVNGTPTLSGGDVETYRRIVNHPLHNLDFFYALLVVARASSNAPDERYEVRHYYLERDDSRVYEIPPDCVERIDAPLVWPGPGRSIEADPGDDDRLDLAPRPERAEDRDFLSEHYPELCPYSSRRLGVYWRGPLELQDGSRVELLVLEDESCDPPSSRVVLRDVPKALRDVAADLAKLEFPTSREAVVAAEAACNGDLEGGIGTGGSS